MNILIKTKFYISKINFLFYIIFKIFRKNDNRIVTNKTHLVIEGYPRSANTYCYSIFKTLDTNLNIASHIHLPVNINLGLNKKIPCIAIIRDPIDCITSYMIRENIEILHAINYYLFFHNNLDVNNNKLLIVKFSTIISNYEKVINKYNHLFNTKYFVNENHNFDELVVERVKKMDMQDTGEDIINHLTVALPSKEREKLKNKYKTLIKIKHYKRLEKCNQLYNKLLTKSKNIFK